MLNKQVDDKMKMQMKALQEGRTDRVSDQPPNASQRSLPQQEPQNGHEINLEIRIRRASSQLVQQAPALAPQDFDDNDGYSALDICMIIMLGIMAIILFYLSFGYFLGFRHVGKY